jgi:hypothetical protein
VTDVGDVVNLLLTVKDGRRFLERLALGFDEEEVDVADLECEERAVYNVL